jgi:phage tail sheath protein FI
MPEYLTPAVDIEQIGRGPSPIEGAPTSTAAFLGETERGALRPRLVTSWGDYRRWFGGVFGEAEYMPYAVHGFFENGGKRLYVCRIVGQGATTASKQFGDFTVSAVGPGEWGRRIWVRIQDGSTTDKDGNRGFRLKLAFWSSVPPGFQPFDPSDPQNRSTPSPPSLFEDHDDLSIDPNSSDYFERRLLDGTTNLAISALATIARTNSGTTTKPPVNAADGEFLDKDGSNDLHALGPEDFEGTPEGGRLDVQGLAALAHDSFREVALLYAPSPRDNAREISLKIIEHCELQRFRFGVVDAGLNDCPGSLDPRSTIKDTEHAALYAPWIYISDPENGARRVVPPGGHVLGVYGRTDSERGVFKAPANEILRGALDLRFDIDDGTQEVMNPRGANAIRRFPERGIRVWGARTMSSNGLWKYVSVRRLFIFLEASIYHGTQWVVFEPNDEHLWARVKDTIRLFLRTQWREGALFGRTENEAFFIACDRTTMTEDDISSGRLICEIGIAPVRPAEFVILRLFQNTAEARR